MSQPAIQLASNSPRRRQILSWAGWPFTVGPANIDESVRTGEAPDRYVLRLATSKAQAAAADSARAGAPEGRPRLIVAADTTVADGTEILGKPADAAEAWRMLAQLRGRTHQVYTALAVYEPATGRMETDVCESDVSMRRYSDAELTAYIASGDPFDKAGAYAIQNQDFHPVDSFGGCYANVMGLPLCRLERLLARFDLVLPPNRVGVNCPGDLGYDCPIYHKIIEDRAEQG